MMGLETVEQMLQANVTWVLGIAPSVSILDKIPLIFGGAFVGGVLSWFYAKRQSLTQHRVQQELWDRKFRLAEADRESAVAALNQNNIDVKKIKGTYEGHVQRISALQTELTNERAQTDGLRGHIDQRQETITRLEGERGAIEGAAASTRAESERKTKVYKEMLTERDSLVTRVDTLTGELEQSRTSHTDDSTRLRAAVIERDKALKAWSRRHAEDQEATGAALAGLEERICELEPFPSRLRTTTEELQAATSQLAALQSTSTDEIGALRGRLTELEPVPAELEEVRAELDEARAERARTLEAHAEEVATREKAAEAELAAVQSRAGDTKAELLTKLGVLEPLPEQLGALSIELELVRDQHDELLASTTAEIETLKEQVEELTPLTQQLADREAELRSLQTTSTAADKAAKDTIEELNVRVSELDPVPAEQAART